MNTMATVYKNYNQAKAAYDFLVAAKDRALRDNEVQKAQALKAVDRRILQNGVTGGHQETTDLKARSAYNGARADIGAKYDLDIASLYAQMKALQQAQSGGGYASGTSKAAEQSTVPKKARRSNYYGTGTGSVSGSSFTPQLRENLVKG